MLDDEVEPGGRAWILPGVWRRCWSRPPWPRSPPVLVALLPGPRIPQVVVLLAGGVLIGPQVLGWGDRPAIDLLANVGLGFLFLLAGYELDLQLFRERPGRLAIVAWLVTVALAAATVEPWRRSGSCGRSSRWPWG
jgi:hypothetical protein